MPELTIGVLVRDPRTARLRMGQALWSEVRPVISDISSAWSLSQPVSHVVHGATPSSIRSGSRDERAVLLTCVNGTNNLIKALANENQPPRILHLSSGAVYGIQPPEIERMPETWTGGPVPFLSTTPYAEGKRAAEALLEAGARAKLVTPIHARLFAFMGPRLPTTDGFAIGNFVRSAALGETVHIHGDGSTVRSYLAAHDLASWLILLLLLGESGTPYNVGSPHGHSLRYWADECASISGVSVRQGEQSIGERRIYVPDVTNSLRLGIPVPHDSPRDALSSWVEWLRAVKE